jgi:hypothetical protein
VNGKLKEVNGDWKRITTNALPPSRYSGIRPGEIEKTEGHIFEASDD